MDKLHRRTTADVVGNNQQRHRRHSGQKPAHDNSDEGIDEMSKVSSTSDEEQEAAVKKGEIDGKIWKFVRGELIFSRVVLVFFQFVFTKIMKEFRTDAFKGVAVDREEKIGDKLVKLVVGGFANWDAVHFLHIGEYGYTWESELAFFPLFPYIIRVFGTGIKFFISQISLNSAMILAGVIINNVCFVMTGLVLFKLVHKLTGSLKESLICVYIFCWNPSSVFFSAVYTESIYSLTTFSGLLVLYQDSTDRLNQGAAAGLFAFSFLTRSNGLLNVGFIGYAVLLETILRSKNNNLNSSKPVFESFGLDFCKKLIKAILWMCLFLAIVQLPLRIFSFSMEDKFCHSTVQNIDDEIQNHAKEHSISTVLPGDVKNLQWCDQDRKPAVLFPPYYSAVQEKYWDVGFLGYWQFKKIPLFVLAAPTLCFIFYGFYDLLDAVLKDNRRHEDVIQDKKLLIPFALHSLFMAFCGLFFYNVEVSARLLFSSSPYIYMVIAKIMSRQTPRIKVPDDLLVPPLPFLFNYALVKPLHFLMLSYLLGYFTVGTMMHVNWLPYV